MKKINIDMRIIVMLIIMEIENWLMEEVGLDCVDFFWFWVFVLVVGFCGFLSFVVLYG